MTIENRRWDSEEIETVTNDTGTAKLVMRFDDVEEEIAIEVFRREPLDGCERASRIVLTYAEADHLSAMLREALDCPTPCHLTETG